MMKMLLLLAVFPLFCLTAGFQELNIDHVDNSGNAFCISFMQNGPSSQPPTLKLHITTNEQDTMHQVMVQYREGAAAEGAITSIMVNVSRDATTTITIPSDLAIAPSTLTSHAAISIKALDPSKSFSVVCQNMQQDSTSASGISTFLAIPVRQYKDILSYEYSHFSVQPAQSDYSMFVLSNCNDDDIAPSLTSPPSLSGQIPVPGVYQRFIDPRNSITDLPTPLRAIEKFESLHFGNNSIDISGIRVTADRAFGFTSGLACSGNGRCDHLSLQIPPSYTWGYSFSTVPVVVNNISSYEIKALPAYNVTRFSFYCDDDNNNGSLLVTHEGFNLAVEAGTLCTFLSDRPIGVVQTLKVDGTNNGGSILWLPPMEQFVKEVTFSSGLSESKDTNQDELTWVTVIPDRDFNASAVLLDGNAFQADQELWNEIACSPMAVCAYSIAVQLSKGRHVFRYDEGRLSVVAIGEPSGTQGVSSYSTGFRLDPIGVPVVSFTRPLYVGSEMASPNITLTRAGDTMVAIDVIITITNIPHPNALPFNNDFQSFNETVHFNVGEREATMALRVRDDLRVESAENFTLSLQPVTGALAITMGIVFLPLGEAILQIYDNDILTLGFTVGSVSVSEEADEVVLILRSSVPLQDSGMNINIRSQAGTATDTFDYTRLDDRFFLQPTESEWRITVDIVNDNRLEDTEYFFVILEVLSSAIEPTLTINRVQVNITDTDNIVIHFEDAEFDVLEGGVSQITLVKDGENDFPVEIFINTEDNTTIAGVDYEAISNLRIEFGTEETEKVFNVTILPDSILEHDETFILRISTNDTRVDTGRPLEVSIRDDDVVEIGFSQSQFSTVEGNGAAVVTVEIVQGSPAERPFKFHVETFQQQALAGRDFVTLDANLEFPPFQSSFNFNITILDNMIAEESSEGFTVGLTRSSSDSLAVSISETARSTVVTIKEDDNVLILMDVSNPVINGREGDPDIQVRLFKSGDIVAVVPVTVFLLVVQSTADESMDFVIVNQMVEFGPDETEKFASIRLMTDSEQENTETFSFILNPLFGPVSVDLNQEITIRIFDTATTSIEFSSSNYTVTEGEDAVLKLIVIGSLNNSINIVLSTVHGSTNDMDYAPLISEAVIIPAGIAEQSISIPTFLDETFEQDEEFTVSIAISGSNDDTIIGQRSSTVVTITDNDGVSVSMSQSSIEVTEGVGNVIVSVQVIGSSDINVSLALTAQDQSTQGNADYIISHDVVSIPAGESLYNLSIPIVNDNVVEMKQEVFTLTLSALQQRVTITEGTTQIRIVDDDVLFVEFNQSIYSVAEDSVGPLVIEIIARGLTELPLNVTVMTEDGTAEGGKDYSTVDRVLLFDRSTTVHSLLINVTNDRVFEGTQQFSIVLESTSDLVVIPSEGGRAVVEIIDGVVSDVSVTLSTSTETVIESNGGLAVFNISIFGVRETNVLIGFNTEPGSAVAFEDYIPIHTTLVLMADETYATVEVTLMNDGVSETVESFYGVIDSAPNPAVTIINNRSDVIIRDDEGAVLTLERTQYVVNEGDTVAINVLRSVDVTEDIRLIVSSRNIDAEGGSDFGVIDGVNVIIPAGQTSFEVATVSPLLDGLFEDSLEDLEVTITLANGDGNSGAIILNNTAVVSIRDNDVLHFTGFNLVTSELDSTANVCFTSNIPSTVPVQLQVTQSPSMTTAEVNKDYNITQTVFNVSPSPHQPPSFCVPLAILMDELQEPDEYLCLIVTSEDQSRVVVSPNTSTEHCPSNAVTVTIQDSGITPSTSPVCYIEDSMVVIPFPRPPLSQSPPYSYHGNCEHVLIQQCRQQPEFTINADHNPNDHSIYGLAIRINSSYVIVNAADMTHTTSGFDMVESIGTGSTLYNGSILVTHSSDTVSGVSSYTIDLISIGIGVELSSDSDSNSTVIAINATRYVEDAHGSLCGLCGTLNGVLLYSDRMTSLTSRGAELVEDFAKSWLVNPEDQITRDTSRECGILGNDTVVGDPLYSVPVYSSDNPLESISLCFEVHGTVNKVFNLISDRCVAVNALYSSMNNPNDGNIITSIGIIAIDNEGNCVDITVSLSTGCSPVVNSDSVSFYSQSGVSVRKHGSKVTVSVANCENEQLVMWLMCRTIDQQRMLDFMIRRGLNLRPTSHGLLGQFWNIPVHLSAYHTQLPELIKDDYDPDKLYLVSVEGPIAHERQFIGELFKRSWDKSLRSCLYVGSSQGGKLSDIPGPKDSVIEGVYTHYIVENGLLSTSFTYSRFDDAVCHN